MHSGLHDKTGSIPGERTEKVKEGKVSIAEANKKHEEYIKIREEAQKTHEKAFEMRSKIMAIKGEKRKLREEAKKALKEQNINARKAVMDEKKLDEIADKSVESLKKGQKITL